VHTLAGSARALGARPVATRLAELEAAMRAGIDAVQRQRHLAALEPLARRLADELERRSAETDA
jgi:HPt (histidine-containing phosphotransfer) domain-containing protein